MALICPHCKAADAIAYVENEDGQTLFPCLFCDRPPSPGPVLSTARVTARCSTAGCGGMVEDRYRYGPAGRVLAVTRRACRGCGSARTGPAARTPHAGNRTLPCPRL
ncbi:hypothetical protein [Streptomyces hebeiensis]